VASIPLQLFEQSDEAFRDAPGSLPPPACRVACARPVAQVEIHPYMVTCCGVWVRATDAADRAQERGLARLRHTVMGVATAAGGSGSHGS
jgi:hypothetical protein